MKRESTLVVACAAAVFAFGGVARSSEILVGLENGLFKAPLRNVEDSDETDFHVRHSWNAVTVTLDINKNLDLHFGLGPLTTTTLEDNETAGDPTYAHDVGFRWTLGLELSQELDMGGGLYIDVSTGAINHTSSDWEYSASATSAKISYVFFDPSRSRPYAGIAYNWYTGVLDHDTDAFDLELEYQFQVNAVGGIRAKADTFTGFMEVVAGGEFTVKLGLEFGF
jgi:hypothetical protein